METAASLSVQGPSSLYGVLRTYLGSADANASTSRISFAALTLQAGAAFDAVIAEGTPIQSFTYFVPFSFVSRSGDFGTITVPPPPAGLQWNPEWLPGRFGITALRNVPATTPDYLALNEDTVGTLDPAANDLPVPGEDPTSLAVTAVTAPAHGTAQVVGPREVLYTPSPDYHGADTFDYTLTDGDGRTATGRVTVDVASVNDPPVAADDAAATQEAVFVLIPVLANDIDDGPGNLFIAQLDPPRSASGQVVGNAIVQNNQVLYSPPAGFTGEVTMPYIAADLGGLSDSAVVRVSVVPFVSTEALPEAVQVSAVAPNPSPGTGRLRIGLPTLADVQVDVVDSLGRRARSWSGPRAAGWSSLDVASGLAPGVYVWRTVVRSGSAAEHVSGSFSVVH